MKPPINTASSMFLSKVSPSSSGLPPWEHAALVSARKAGNRLSWKEVEWAVRFSPSLVALSTWEEGRILAVNDSFCRFIGYSRDEVVGKTSTELGLWTDRSQRLDIALSLARHGHVDQISLNVRIHNGESRSSLLSLKLLEIEGVRCVYGIGFDITNRAKRESEHSNTIRQIMAESAAKTELLCSASHELRTPLSIVMGYLQLLQNEIREGGSSAQTRDYLDRAAKGSQTLLHLVNQLLDLQKLEADAPALEMQPVDLLSEIHAIHADFSHVAAQKDLEWVMDIEQSVPAKLHTDPHRLRQILHNLIGNAFKFTQSGEVRLTMRRLPDSHGEGTLEISISDSGRGIAPEARDRIFSPFQQESSQTQKAYGGTGLGLTIARKLAQRLGGDLALSWTALGQGSCFSLTLPLRAQPLRRVGAEESPTEA